MDGHVESELASLRAEVASLRRELTELRSTPQAEQRERSVSRRALMGLAGAGVAGAVVAVAGPAGAANGDPLVLGQANTASSVTSLTGHLSVSSLAATGIDVAAGGGNGVRAETDGGLAIEAIDSGEIGGIAATFSSRSRNAPGSGVHSTSALAARSKGAVVRMLATARAKAIRKSPSARSADEGPSRKART